MSAIELLRQVQQRNKDVLTALSALGYDLVGSPKRSGGGILLSFRRGDDDGFAAFEGELSIWLEQLQQEPPKQMRLL